MVNPLNKNEKRDKMFESFIKNQEMKNKFSELAY